MVPLQEEFRNALESVHVPVSEIGLFHTFTQLTDDTHIQAFSKVLCDFTSRKDWIAQGQPKFFDTQVWKRVRYLALAKYGNKCQCCGHGPQTGAVLHVDHVKPRSKYPKLALSQDNLQVLCADCNLGKSNVDETDWRSK